jgi:spore coat protein A
VTRRLLAIFILMFLLSGAIRASVPGAISSIAGDPSPPNIPQFVDELPIPERIRFQGQGPFHLAVKLGEIRSKIHRDLPPITQWGYNGTSPGPTIEVEQGQKLDVEWQNELPSKHLFPAPNGMESMSPNMPDVRAVTHLHGADVTEASPMDRSHDNDGWPDAWTVAGQTQNAEYPNDQSARTLWYHDHAMGETGRNVAAGLLGLYVIHDPYERSLNLPQGTYEIPIMLQSRGVSPEGSLYYSSDISTEYYGNAVEVNGMLWPNLTVEPRKYRFRVINVSNARTYSMKLQDPADVTDQGAGPAFYQIGSDAGFLENTAVLNDPADPNSPRLTLAPAERADVIIDFSKMAGRSFVLVNNSHDPGDNEASVPEIMQFKVIKSLSRPDTSALPMKMKLIPRTSPDHIAGTRQIVLSQMNMPNGTPMLTLNGQSWGDPITEKPVLGTTEVWELVNTLTDYHPFHIHEVQFQVLDRTFFDVEGYLATGKINYLAPPVAPSPNEMGWKDTVRVFPQMVTRIMIQFGPNPGYFVYHCHILEHEDMDMMRPFQILSPATQ